MEAAKKRLREEYNKIADEEEKALMMLLSSAPGLTKRQIMQTFKPKKYQTRTHWGLVVSRLRNQGVLDLENNKYYLAESKEMELG